MPRTSSARVGVKYAVGVRVRARQGAHEAQPGPVHSPRRGRGAQRAIRLRAHPGRSAVAPTMRVMSRWWLPSWSPSARGRLDATKGGRLAQAGETGRCFRSKDAWAVLVSLGSRRLPKASPISVFGQRTVDPKMAMDCIWPRCRWYRRKKGNLGVSTGTRSPPAVGARGPGSYARGSPFARLCPNFQHAVVIVFSAHPPLAAPSHRTDEGRGQALPTRPLASVVSPHLCSLTRQRLRTRIGDESSQAASGQPGSRLCARLGGG